MRTRKGPKKDKKGLKVTQILAVLWSLFLKLVFVKTDWCVVQELGLVQGLVQELVQDLVQGLVEELVQGLV